MERKVIIPDINFDNLIEEVLALKKKDFNFVKEERVFTEELKKISLSLKHMKFPLNMKYHTDKINQRNQIEVVEDTINLLSLVLGENKKGVNKSIASILSKIEVNIDETLYMHTTDITYKEGKKPIVKSVSIAPVQSTIQSISLARTIIEAMKNENPKEFYNLWKHNYTVPFFLEEYFAKKMSKEKGNEDILKMTRFLRMWSIQVQNMYYRRMCNVYYHEKTGAELYKAKMYMILHAYPNLKGYIDALKLLKVVENEKSGNVKPVLKEIRNVLEHTKTTGQLLEELEIHKIDSREIVNERCKLIQKQYK